MKRFRISILLLFSLWFSGCLPDIPDNLSGKFANMQSMIADQQFKMAISFIELHKIRYNKYPEKIGDLKYTGNQKATFKSFVEYKKLKNGYELNLLDMKSREPLKPSESEKLKYPADFWQGLGLKKSNMKK